MIGVIGGMTGRGREGDQGHLKGGRHSRPNRKMIPRRKNCDTDPDQVHTHRIALRARILQLLDPDRVVSLAAVHVLATIQGEAHVRLPPVRNQLRLGSLRDKL